jgi:hypothetical protein
VQSFHYHFRLDAFLINSFWLRPRAAVARAVKSLLGHDSLQVTWLPWYLFFGNSIEVPHLVGPVEVTVVVHQTQDHVLEPF